MAHEFGTKQPTVLPKAPLHLRQTDEELYNYINRLTRMLEKILASLNQPYAAGTTGWAPTNVPSASRTPDGISATATQVRESLVRLIQDLKDAGALAA